jgi:aspartate aminotransferase
MNLMNQKQLLSERVIRMEESATLAMARKGRILKEQGIDVITLSVGEPDFFTPDFIKDAAKKGIDENYSFYSPVCGYGDLKAAISHKLKRDNGLEYAPDQIIVSNGAKQSIANVLLAIIGEGDEVIVPAPYWVSYTELIRLADGDPVCIEASIENDFKVTPAQIEAAITTNTKAFIFSSPCNPTGTVYSKSELHDIAKVIGKHPGIIVISDEIYEHINFVGKHESIGQFEELKDRVVTINGVSKAFAMPGWRIGYMAAPMEIVKACDKIQGQITSGASSIAQRAALAAIERDPNEIPELRTMLEAFRERRDLVVAMLKDIPGLKVNMPEGAFYVFIDVSSFFGKSDGENIMQNDNDLCMYLLEKGNVALVPGSAFGDSQCLRISYATSIGKLKEACRRIADSLCSLKA